MALVTLACHAMATRFEVALHGENPVALRAAGEEALHEITRLEAQLSLFKPTSEIAHLNARASEHPVRVEPSLFALLERAQRLSRETGGAFDITVGPLMKCWGFTNGTGKQPEPAALEEARAKVGMDLVELNAVDYTVRFKRPGVVLDLGSIGKGYALERATELLRDAGIQSALLHGGTSTVCAIGAPPGATAWQVAIPNPVKQLLNTEPLKKENPSEERPLAVVSLQDESLSMSAVWGKSFSEGEDVFGHVIDPRTGCPAQRAIAAVVVTPSATESDALSTALLTLGSGGIETILHRLPNSRIMVVSRDAGRFAVHTKGIELIDSAGGSGVLK